jgi:hypothetical protein
VRFRKSREYSISSTSVSYFVKIVIIGTEATTEHPSEQGRPKTYQDQVLQQPSFERILQRLFRTDVRPLIVAQGSTTYQSTDSDVYEKINEGLVNLPDSVNLIFYIWHIFAGFQKIDHCLEVSVLSGLKPLTIVQNESSVFAGYDGGVYIRSACLIFRHCLRYLSLHRSRGGSPRACSPLP